MTRLKPDNNFYLKAFVNAFELNETAMAKKVARQ
jgi:hypothetical protein